LVCPAARTRNAISPAVPAASNPSGVGANESSGSASQQDEHDGPIWVTLLLHEGKHESADFTESMILIKAECLRLHTLRKRYDLCHA
jgi:hypothetical protein